MFRKLYKFCYTKKIEAVNDFEKGFNRLLKNVLYGKTMENIREQTEVVFFK